MVAKAPFDLLVIGAGPGGYVAAIRAAQLGMRVASVEKEFLGGVCLNVGCIPSKALLDSTHHYDEARHIFARHGIRCGELSFDWPAMLQHKDETVRALTSGVGFLFKKNKVESIKGTARILAPGRVQVTASDNTSSEIAAQRILIATGSIPTQIPSLPFDEQHILSSTGALSLPQIPKRVIVVGAGYIGLELSSVFARLGTEILVLEVLDRALPGMDHEMAAQLQKILEKQGLKFRFNTTARSARIANGQVSLEWSSGSQQGMEQTDKVLVAVGRRPLTSGLGIEDVGIQLDTRGFIKVDPTPFATNIPGIYAIGDVIGGLMLAHKAQEEGLAAVERMAGIAAHVNYAACPAVVFTHPELAQVGFTESDAARQGPIKVGRFPLTANGRARAMAETQGLVKIIADAKTDRVLGVHILAAHASDMIAEVALAMEFAASAEDIARSFHAHPTLPEAIKEAALAVDGRAIHI